MKHYFKVKNANGKLEMEYRDQLEAIRHAQAIKGIVTFANIMIRDCREYAYVDSLCAVVK